MVTRASLDLEIALDEGSRVSAEAKDGASILGAILLTRQAADAAERALRERRSFPKWADASKRDARAVLKVFRHLGGYGKAVIIKKSSETASSYRATAERELTEDRRRLREISRASGQESPEYPTSPHLFLRTTAFAGVLPIREVAVHQAIISGLDKRANTLSVGLNVLLDKDSTPPQILEAMANGIRRFASEFRRFRYGDAQMNVECHLDTFEGRDESEQASLILVDYINGIIATSVFPKYQHRSISREVAAELYKELENYGKQNHTVSVKEIGIADLEEMTRKAGAESQEDFKRLGLS
jgi:hypothetical protein